MFSDWTRAEYSTQMRVLINMKRGAVNNNLMLTLLTLFPTATALISNIWRWRGFNKSTEKKNSSSFNGNISPWITLGFEMLSACDNQCIPGVILGWNAVIYSATVGASFYLPLLRLMASSVFPEWLSTIPSQNRPQLVAPSFWLKVQAGRAGERRW